MIMHTYMHVCRYVQGMYTEAFEGLGVQCNTSSAAAATAVMDVVVVSSGLEQNLIKMEDCVLAAEYHVNDKL